MNETLEIGNESNGRHESSWLHVGATGAARRLAIARLDETEKPLARFLEDRDDDLLHDFRVALRRLRSTLKAYRPWLGRAAGKKLRRRLGDLADATNRGRDADVQAKWIRKESEAWLESARAAADAVVEALCDTHRPSPHKLEDKLKGIAKKLRHRLSKLDERDGAFAPVLRVLARRHADDVALSLERITGADDVEAAHAARIAVKRLRYLVEPMGSSEALEALQDRLVELHDAHVLDTALSRLRQDGDASTLADTIDDLLRANDERAADAYDEIAHTWLGGRSEARLDVVVERAEQALAEI